MSKSISLPDEILQKAAELAAQEHVSIEEFVAVALSEQFAGREYLKARAARARRERFQAAMGQIPDVEPDEHDRL
jgi:hypothetical protein